jgi:flavin-dependent trigonelline monooxygenase, reductase component
MTVATLDPRALRDAFGAFVTGVTIVTTRDEAGKPVGFTANSFTSVSLDPPLLLICLARTSRNFATMTGAKNFAVNILSEGQKDLSNTFARPVEDRFAAAIWSDAPAGSPVFTDVAAWFECSMQEVIEAGDHVILLGRIDAFENSGLNGLGYARGGYFTPMLAAKALSAAAEGEIAVGAVLERRGEIYLVGEDVLSLPGCVVAGGDPVAALTARLEELTGLTVRTGGWASAHRLPRAGGWGRCAAPGPFSVARRAGFGKVRLRRDGGHCQPVRAGKFNRQFRCLCR